MLAAALALPASVHADVRQPGQVGQAAAGASGGAQSPVPNPPQATGRSQQQERPTFGVRVDQVSVDVEVIDRSGMPVTGLKKSDFRVREDGRLMEIVSFSWLESRPVSLVFVLDTSTMPRARLLVAKDLISRLVHLLGREDEIALFTSDHKGAYVEQGFTADRPLLVEALENLDVPARRRRNVLREWFSHQPATGLGIDLALALARKGNREKKAVILVSDRFRGLGPAVVDHVREAGLTLMTVRLDDGGGRVATSLGDQESREQILAESGGREFRTGADDLAGECRSVARALKSHYNVGYLTRVEQADRRTRRIEIEVPGCDCVTYARRSYSPYR